MMVGFDARSEKMTIDCRFNFGTAPCKKGDTPIDEECNLQCTRRGDVSGTCDYASVLPGTTLTPVCFCKPKNCKFS